MSRRGLRLTNDDEQDRFGIPESAFAAALRAQSSAPVIRCGMYVPTRAEVRTMAPKTLRPLLIEWLWESPSELIPTNEQIGQVKSILEGRPDAYSDADLGELIDECRSYIEG